LKYLGIQIFFRLYHRGFTVANRIENAVAAWNYRFFILCFLKNNYNVVMPVSRSVRKLLVRFATPIVCQSSVRMKRHSNHAGRAIRRREGLPSLRLKLAGRDHGAIF
jgi:hypothetical protein